MVIVFMILSDIGMIVYTIIVTRYVNILFSQVRFYTNKEK